jgi:two-component system, OmpR family, sensor kinase
MFDSVRVRLTLWYTGVLALVLICLAAAMYWALDRTMARRTDASLAETSDGFISTLQAEYNDQLKENPSGDALLAAAQESVQEFRLRDHRFAVLDSKDKLLAESEPLPERRQRERREAAYPATVPELSADAWRRVEGEAGDRGFADVLVGAVHFRARVTQARVASERVTLVALESLELQRDFMEDIRATLLWVIPAALLIASIGGYFLARKSLAPVVAMSETAARIGARNLHQRLPVQNARDELGYLASTFNGLLERLDRSFEQQRRFMADASHELRSPVAIIRGEAEVALSKARTSEEYRESLAIALDEAQRLSQIVDDLLTLARADAGEYRLRPRDFYLEELAVDCVRAARTMAAARGIALSYEPDGEMPIRADEALVRRLVMNLLDNGIKYTPQGGKVSVACSHAGGEYAVTVRDTGPGIPAEARDKIFERFFRLDPARTPAPRTSGAGLGLAIARWIAEAHHGRLLLVHSDASGSAFTAFLPANRSAGERVQVASANRESSG